MLMSRVKLDVWKRKTILALNSPEIIHAVIEKSLNGNENERALWRIDTLGQEKYLLIVSRNKPDLQIIEEQFGEYGQTKPYKSFLESLKQGNQYRFKIQCVPSKCRKESLNLGRARGKQVSILRQEEQIAWFERQSEKHGFKIDSLKITRSKETAFYKGKQKKRVSFLSVTFQGVLTINDIEEFKDLMEKGLGREKAYGQGLMTVIPVSIPGENKSA